MRTSLAVVVLLALGGTVPSAAPDPSHSFAPDAPMNKLTPIITVDAVEPCLPFWTEKLGFELTATVPHGETVGFAMLAKGGVEIMYQSRASVEDDLGEAGAATGHPDLARRMGTGMTTLFIEVDAIDPVVEALGDDADVVVPRRQTFYGMDEIFVQAPCGTLVGFAAQVGEDEG
jgi:uncharacterized glyoxalase superfamily protein PhnB